MEIEPSIPDSPATLFEELRHDRFNMVRFRQARREQEFIDAHAVPTEFRASCAVHWSTRRPHVLFRRRMEQLR